MGGSMQADQPDLCPIPMNPVPPGAQPQWITTKDGIRLRTVRWTKPGSSRGTVAVLHGYSEFVEKYFEVIEELLARGFDVVAMDWRGHGLSERLLGDRRKGHIDDFSAYLDDLAALEAQVLALHCPKPWFALGHSMGGANLIAQAHAGTSPFQRLILSAPMIDLIGLNIRGAKPLLEILDLLGFGGWTIPGGSKKPGGLQPFKSNLSTSDRDRYARTAALLRASPALCIGDPTVAWTHAASRLTRAFADIDYPRQITTPILVLGAGNDARIPLPATELFASRLKAGQFITIPYARHEILMEHDSIRRQFWAAFDAFIPGHTDEFAARLERAASVPPPRRRLWPLPQTRPRLSR